MLPPLLPLFDPAHMIFFTLDIHDLAVQFRHCLYFNYKTITSRQPGLEKK